MLRPVPVNHYLAVMRRRGFRNEELLCHTNIDPEQLADPDYLITHEDHERFIANIVRLGGDRGIGLDLGLTHEAAHFGILAYCGLACRTIRAGMEDVWSRYGNAFGVTTRLAIVWQDLQTAQVEIIAPRTADATYRFAIEEALTVLLTIGGWATGEETPFVSLEFAFPAPAYARRYQEIFHCPVRFDALRTRVSIRRAWLDSPLRTNDPELHRVCHGHLDRVLRQTEAASPFTLRLRHFLLQRISDLPTMADAAKEFRMSSRSLARLLRREGYSYRLLTEELRRELALDWLRQSDIHAKEIAYRLGFQDVGAFRRAFREWTGKSVTEYRVAVGAIAPRVIGAQDAA